MENKKGRRILLKDSNRDPTAGRCLEAWLFEEGPREAREAQEAWGQLLHQTWSPGWISWPCSGLFPGGGRISGPGTCCSLIQGTALAVTWFLASYSLIPVPHR